MKEYLKDVGHGPLVKTDARCNKCSSLCKPAVGSLDMYICKRCRALTDDVTLQRVRMFSVTA